MASLSHRFQALLHKCRSRGHLLTLAVLAWVINYIRGVRRVALHLGQGDCSSEAHGTARKRLARIARRCPSFSMIYWPAWFAPDAYSQFVLIGLKELRARLLQRSPYSRQILTLRDGAQIALDWARPELVQNSRCKDMIPKDDDTLPVCVILHGAFMDSASVTMTDLTRDLAASGLPVVVMNRRGYGGIGISADTPGLALFGLDDDLDEVLISVSKKEPKRPIVIVGFSCGSGFAGRYVGNRSHISLWPDCQMNKTSPSPLPKILCSVVVDPGYDVSPSGAIKKMQPPISWVVNWCLKYFYVFRHRCELRKKSGSYSDLVDNLLSPKHGAADTLRLTKRLAGVDGSREWLKIQQPVLSDIDIPSLAINSRDDPVCVWGNVEAYWEEIKTNPNLALADFARGGHGCKFGFWGGANVSHRMVSEFIKACWTEWRRSS